MKKKIIVAIGGASGSIYAKVLLDKLVLLQSQIEKVGIVMSDNAKYNWELELNNTDFRNYPFDFYKKNDFMAPFASGSARYETMIACPCSMGLLGRIATGVSDDLSTSSSRVRAAVGSHLYQSSDSLLSSDGSRYSHIMVSRSRLSDFSCFSMRHMMYMHVSKSVR